ncbi:phage tail spike protein [Companilactobacillus farciminis]|uniref:phage tail spike protein n=1 Tax=Companilactobacillus farciminis TaxID=1612 RepID=UPI00241EA603|nr:phage tail spike protein [Companilactobacillus farciminis]
MNYLQYPVLFESSESDFTTQGIGVLTDCLSVEVTNEFNELPELKLDYLATGDIANELIKDRIIMADVGEGYLKQLFRIDSVKKSIDNKIEVTASHILNDLSYNTLKQNINASAVTPVAAFNLLKNQLEQPEPKLKMISSITGTTNISWDMTKIDNAKKALGGADGSLLQQFKGEYLFDNYTVHYERTIGNKTGKVIEYGKDLVQANQEENIEETYSAIKPFTKVGSGDDERIVYLPERIIKTNRNFEKLRVLTKDFSQDKLETVDQLRSRTNKYITDNKVGIPKVSLTFEIADVKDDLGFVDELKMGDEVTVFFANLDIDTTARVIKTVWDGLLHRYKTVSIGDKPTTTSDYQTEQNEHIDTVDKSTQENSKDVAEVKEDLESTAAEAQRRIDAVKQDVVDTQSDMTKVMNNGGNNKIEWSPNLMNATQMKIHTSYGYWLLDDAGAGFHKNDGTVMNGLSADGRIYADSITGNTLTGTTINGGTVNGGIIDGAKFIAGSIETKSHAQFLNSSGQVSTSIASYGISTPALTVDGNIDRVINANIQYLHVSGNISGNASGLYLQGPVYVDGRKI